METDACPEISVLSSFLDDEIERDDETLKLHIQNCPSCTERLKRFEAADHWAIKYLEEPMTFSDRSHKENCLSAELMTSYLHDLLSAEEKKSVEGHLDVCDICLSEFSSLTKARVQFERSKEEPLPDSLRQRVEAYWTKGQKGKEQILRLAVRLARDGIEIIRDSLLPSAVTVQEMFAPVGAYRTAEKASLPSGILLKKTLPGIQLSAMLEWKGTNRAGLQIKIEDERLNPLAGQRVLLRRDEVLFFSERTGKDGGVQISDLDPGNYQFGIVVSGREFYVDLQLEKAS